jgi:hypothetical protein
MDQDPLLANKLPFTEDEIAAALELVMSPADARATAKLRLAQLHEAIGYIAIANRDDQIPHADLLVLLAALSGELRERADRYVRLWLDEQRRTESWLAENFEGIVVVSEDSRWRNWERMKEEALNRLSGQRDA